MPSRHSGSSRSSFSSSSRSSSSRSSSRSSYSSPSSHSSSSHSSWGSSSTYSRYRTPNGYRLGPRTQFRFTYNQPVGYYSFWNWYRQRPTVYYCISHNYTYYPESWTSEGRTYQAGYYDETGKYYSEKPFIEKQVGKIYTKCPNCNYVKDYDYMDFDELENCPECGRKMVIANEDDDIFIREEEIEPLHSKILRIGLAGILGLSVTMLLFTGYNSIKNKFFSQNNNSTYQIVENYETVGKVIYLKKSGKNYKFSDANNYDLKLTRDSDDNYYDKNTGLYLYYFREYDVWQYWYEPISGNFGDYGWMEHDAEGWWIEADHNNWIKVPSNFDTSNLWYIEWERMR